MITQPFLLQLRLLNYFALKESMYHLFTMRMSMFQVYHT